MSRGRKLSRLVSHLTELTQVAKTQAMASSTVKLARTDVTDREWDRRQEVSRTPCDDGGDYVSNGVTWCRQHVYRVDACLQIESLYTDVRASATPVEANVSSRGVAFAAAISSGTVAIPAVRPATST